MILTIDIGNTCTKATVFNEDDNIVTHCRKGEFTTDKWRGLIGKYNITKAIVSSVNARVCVQIERTLKHLAVDCIVIDHNLDLPFVIDYETPDTLGRDRIAAMAGAVAVYGEGNYLVVDAGTCITYDILANGHFIGGNIAPGLQMRLDAMNVFTSGLPKTDLSVPESDLGLNTIQAMKCGAFWGVIYEIKEMTERYSMKYDKLRCIMTGGISEMLKKRFDNTDNILWEPMLVQKGLNFIAKMQS